MQLLVLYHRNDKAYWEQFQQHLLHLQRQGVIQLFHEGSILAGANTANSMQQYLQQADMILLLISADFIASDKLCQYAVQALQQGKRIVPILLRPCMWQDTEWGTLPHLPEKPIALYAPPETGFYEAVIGLRKMIDPNYTPPNVEEFKKEVENKNPVYQQIAEKIYNINHIDKADFS